ncbi:NAD(P)/FAD-dependent oxidoreductase [Candidatus Woesearchaeota archaeon]|nr:NAD(P)/FAD-dependent oxidoreductase [Candidatus Woesearchaeota archaeon]
MNIKTAPERSEQSPEPNSCDVIIIGAGPAGMCAALYLTRANLSVLLIGEHTNGLLAKAAIVGNHLGLDSLSGIEMLNRFLEHCKQYNVHHNPGEVTHTWGENGNFFVKLNDGSERKAKKLIIASGAAYTHAGIKGENGLTGKGIAYCVACDGPLFAGKKVIVIGNGDFAAEEALEMLAHTNTIHIVTQGKAISMGKQYREALLTNKIPIREEKITEAKGDQKLTDIAFLDGHTEPCDAIFVALGSASAVAFANKLGLEMDKNVIKVDKDMRTSADGVFAAGGAIGGNIQIAKSLGDGCNAAIAIIKEIRGVAIYVDH